MEHGEIQRAAGSRQRDDAEMGRDGDAARKSQRADDGRQLAGAAGRKRNQRHEVCLKVMGLE
ncbi:MAG: hypothetical protein P8X67_03285 [Syntrophobacterales bacterium]